jgi:lipid II:glycine glycyltransferase (peptidoglycan interpeptide bridge formation enzyme)
LAYYQGQPAGGLVMLKFKNYYFDWFAGMNKELRSSRANDYLHADLIKESIEKGYTMINFGASADLMGVQKFKESFGAKETAYNIYFSGNLIEKAALHLIMKVFY